MRELTVLAEDFIQGSRGTAVLRILMGLLFIYSGIFKAIDPENFSRAVQNYDVLPLLLVPYCAMIIPYVEMITGLLLSAGWKIRPASLILLCLMMIFTAAIAVNVLRGRSFDCGCFELKIFGIKETVSAWLVMRDLMIAAILLMFLSGKRYYYSIDGREGR